MPTIEETTLFDAGTLEYDLEKYPFNKWVLDRVRANGYPDIDDLEKVHEHVKTADQPKLTKALISDAGGAEFQEMIYAFVDDYIKPLLKTELAIQRYPNIRFVRPVRPDMVLPYHQGIWVGHGWGEGTIWAPITRAFDSNTMQIADLEPSRKLTKQIITERWSRAKMQEVLGEACHPCNVNPGQAICFTEGNIHGNVENKTGMTRVSMDFRVLEADGQFHRKPPGGYFVVPGTYENRSGQAETKPRTEEEQLHTISYSECQTAATVGLPVPLQRLAIKEYCEKRSIRFSFEHVELEGLLHCPILMGLITQDKPDEILMYSIYALPEEAEYRKAVMDAALANNVVLHFVNELTVMRTQADVDVIEKTLRFTRDFSSPVVTTNDLAAA